MKSVIEGTRPKLAKAADGGGRSALQRKVRREQQQKVVSQAFSHIHSTTCGSKRLRGGDDLEQILPIGPQDTAVMRLTGT